MKAGTYFAWYDDDKKRGVDTKLFQGAQAFEDRFGKQPTACTVPAGTFAEAMVMGIQIEIGATVPPDTFWFA